MKISKRTRTIILWCIAIGLLAGMIIQFTPTLGFNLGGQEAVRGTVQLTVNGVEIREAEVLQAQQGTLYNAVSEGPVAAQLQRLLVDDLVRQEVVRQAAAPMRVTNAQVRAEVDAFRAANGLAGRRNDSAYLARLRQVGFTDQTFRDYLREQLKLQAWQDSVLGDVAVPDAEIEAYYLSHQSSYQSEERVRARQIVVSDRETAEDIRARVAAGESFAELAAERSLELADRQGAVGAPAGETEPRPVGRAAFPTAVANAAFALRGAGLTEVIAAADGFYLVQVVEYLPAATRPLEEVRDARIAEVQLDRATYMNTTIQQALSPDTAELIVQLFRPAILQQLIDTELAYQGARSLGVDFVGSRAAIAQAALNYVARDATVTDEQVREYYEANVAAFTVGPEAVVTQVELASQEAAAAFRAEVLGGADVAAAAAEHGGEVVEHGRVLPGTLEADIDTALFGTDAFEPIAGSAAEVSDVLVIARPVEEEDDAADAAGDEEADGAADEADEPDAP